MSKIKDVIMDIETDIRAGELTLVQIAKKYDVTVTFVTQIYCEMVEQDFDDE